MSRMAIHNGTLSRWTFGYRHDVGVGIAVEATATFVKHTPRSGGQAARPSRASTRVVRSASAPTVRLAADALHVQGFAEAVGPRLDPVELGVGQLGW